MPIRYKYRLPGPEDYRTAWIKLIACLAIGVVALVVRRQALEGSVLEGSVTLVLVQCAILVLDSVFMMLGGKVSPDRPSFANYLLPMQEAAGGLMMLDLILLIALGVRLFKAIF